MTETVLELIETPVEKPDKSLTHICCRFCKTIVCSGNKAEKTWPVADLPAPEDCVVCADMEKAWFPGHAPKCPNRNPEE